MGNARVSYKNFIVSDVSNYPELWQNKDPVRPHLSDSFRTNKGRVVLSLHNGSTYAAFLCLAKTIKVPVDEEKLDEYSDSSGHIGVPYSVWSYMPGAGKTLVNRVINMAEEKYGIKRVVTLSPKTAMAKRFHLKNGAKELSLNKDSVNFEY